MIHLACEVEIYNGSLGHGDEITELVFQLLKAILMIADEVLEAITSKHMLSVKVLYPGCI